MCIEAEKKCGAATCNNACGQQKSALAGVTALEAAVVLANANVKLFFTLKPESTAERPGHA